MNYLLAVIFAGLAWNLPRRDMSGPDLVDGSGFIWFPSPPADDAWLPVAHQAQSDSVDAVSVDAVPDQASEQPPAAAGPASAIFQQFNSMVDTVITKTSSVLGLWHAPTKYADTIAQAEHDDSIPAGMLERLLHQESRYREDIITGRTRSPVGALGIAQFMPATAAEMGIDPLDSVQAIGGAGRYLAGLYRQFGDWFRALAASNCGPGNVRRKGLEMAPNETGTHYTQILADVNSYSGSMLA